MRRQVHRNIILLIALLISGAVRSEVLQFNAINKDTLKIHSYVVHNESYSKKPAILMRDTTLSGNRFSSHWLHGSTQKGDFSGENYQLKAFLIDSTLAAFCDSLLLNNPNNNKIILTGWPKKSIKTLVKKCIRLYIGCVDESGNKNVVVQFVSEKEYEKEKNYSSQLYLVVPRKELHFAVIAV